jgi:hypothetical protein
MKRTRQKTKPAREKVLREKALEFFAGAMLAQGATLTPGNKEAEEALIKAKKKRREQT